MILGLGCPAACGGNLWAIYNTMLGPWGWQAGRIQPNPTESAAKVVGIDTECAGIRLKW